MANRFGDQEAGAPLPPGPIVIHSREQLAEQFERLNAPPAAPRAAVNRFGDTVAAPPRATDEERRTMLGFLGNVGTSTGRLLGGLVNVPEQVKGVTALFADMAAKSGFKPLPGQPAGAVDALIAHYKDRYGSWQGFEKAMYEDPAGVAMDVAMVLEPAGAGLKVAGLPRAAAVTTRVAREINPVAQTIRAGVAAAPYVGPALKVAGAGVRAAAPDVATGAAKAAVGYGLSSLPIPGPVQYGLGFPTVALGARQIQRGLMKGVRAGREALKARAAAAAEALAAETAAAEAAAEAAARPQPPPEAIPPTAAPPEPPPGPVTPPPSPQVPVAPTAELAPQTPPAVAMNPAAQQAAIALREAMGLGPEELRPPAAEAPDFAAITQAGHVDRVARLMREHGLTAADATLLDPPDWINLARSAGIANPEAGGALAKDVVLRLQSLEPKATAPARKPRARAAAAAAPAAEPVAPPPAAPAPPVSSGVAGVPPSPAAAGGGETGQAPLPAEPRTRPGPAGAAAALREALGLGPEELRPPTVETAPALTASERRVRTLAKDLLENGFPEEGIEKRAQKLGLARPAAGELQQILDEIERLHSEAAVKPAALQPTPVAKAKADFAAAKAAAHVIRKNVPQALLYRSNANTARAGHYWASPSREYAEGVGNRPGAIERLDFPRDAKILDLGHQGGYTPDGAVAALKKAFPKATQAELESLIDRSLWTENDRQHYDIPDLIHTTNEQPGDLLAGLLERHGYDAAKFQEALQGSDMAHEGRIQRGRVKTYFITK